MNKQLEMESQFSGKVKLELEINSYMDNNRMYIGLVEVNGEYPEPFADLTVNINGPCPDYCGYVDINTCPELERFIQKNGLGEFTGFMGNSGFCSYPLYQFNVEKLRELAPESMEQYENEKRRRESVAKELKIRVLTEEEQKYTYVQSRQLDKQTGNIGYLRGDFGSTGNSFSTTWTDCMKEYKIDNFREELSEIIHALRSMEHGLFLSQLAMIEYVGKHPDSLFEGDGGIASGFRVDTEKHAYLIRCNPVQEDYNFYCYCYVSEYLDKHIANARQGIRFVDSHYKELFRIPGGGKIVITELGREQRERVCRFLDEYHIEVGSDFYHICEFAEIMERNGNSYGPAQKKSMEKKPPGTAR